MLRALSTRSFRGSFHDYEKLTEEDVPQPPGSPTMVAKLDRGTSVPAKVFTLTAPGKSTSDHNQKKAPEEKSTAKQAKKGSKIHPVFNLVDSRSRRKATAKPEFSRYLQYLREGGIWELKSDTSVSR